MQKIERRLRNIENQGIPIQYEKRRHLGPQNRCPFAKAFSYYFGRCNSGNYSGAKPDFKSVYAYEIRCQSRNLRMNPMPDGNPFEVNRKSSSAVCGIGIKIKNPNYCKTICRLIHTRKFVKLIIRKNLQNLV